MTPCDASPLIALINKGDKNHQTCVNILPSLSAPLLTTCACFTEAMYLLGRYGGWLAQQELWGYVADNILLIQEPFPNHFYWPDLDVDLSKEIIQNPDRFPLKA